MKIETQRQDNCTATLTVEVDDERVQPALRAAARRLSQKHPVPGYRPGKAPYEVVLRQFGEQALYEYALDDLTQKVYEAALEQEQLDPYASGSLDDVQLKPMVLKFSVPLRPEVDLGDYRALRVPYTAPEVKDEAVTEALEHLREHHAVLDPVDRPAALGDVVVVDVKGYLHEGENPSDFLLADKDVPLLMNAENEWPMPGFAQQIIGMKAGEGKKFDLTFADDYANTSLRGQTAHYEVQAKEVKSRTLPEWSDELAKEMGDYQSLEDVRQKRREDLRRQTERGVDQEYISQVVDRLVEQTALKYPPVMLEHELDEVLDDYDRRLREQHLTLDDYLKIENKTKEQFREEQRPQAERRLKRALVLGKVVELEHLEVSAADVDHEINYFTQLVGKAGENLRKSLSSSRARSAMALEMLTNKALQRLRALAKGEEVPLPGAEAKAETAPAETATAEVNAQG